MFDSKDFNMIIIEILNNLANLGGTPSLQQVLPAEQVSKDKLDLIIRYMSEEALIYIVAMGKGYSDPTIRLNIRPKGIKYIEEQLIVNEVETSIKEIDKDIFNLVNQRYRKTKANIKYLEKLESIQITLLPGSTEEKLVESRIKQINQFVQRQYSKSANIKSWLAFGVSIISIMLALIKLVLPTN